MVFEHLSVLYILPDWIYYVFSIIPDYLIYYRQNFSFHFQLKSLHKAILFKHKKTEQETRNLQENIGIAFGIGAAVLAAGVGFALALRKK